MALVSIVISVLEFVYMSSHMGVKGYKVLRRLIFGLIGELDLEEESIKQREEPFVDAGQNLESLRESRLSTKA